MDDLHIALGGGWTLTLHEAHGGAHASAAVLAVTHADAPGIDHVLTSREARDLSGWLTEWMGAS